MQNGVQQRLVNIDFAVVIDEAQSAKLVHEETNTGSCRADHFSQRFLAKRNRYDRWIYLTKACRTCPLKDQCTTANERRIKRWEHEHVVEAAQTRLDQNPQVMRVRRETVEHPFATLKMRMGATHFLMKRLPNVATETALNVLSYNLTRVLNIVGVKPLLAAMRA
jgi:hypothetical protein